MVFKMQDFMNCMRAFIRSAWHCIQELMNVGPRGRQLVRSIRRDVINIGVSLHCIFSCHNILMSNHSTIVLGYLLLYGYDVNSAAAFSLRLLGLLIGGILTAVVFTEVIKTELINEHLHSIFKEFHIHSSRTKWQIAMTFGMRR